jgi:hypothetical protein
MAREDSAQAPLVAGHVCVGAPKSGCQVLHSHTAGARRSAAAQRFATQDLTPGRLTTERKRLADAHAVELVLFLQHCLADEAIHREQRLDARLRLLERRVDRVRVARERRVRRRVGIGAAIGRELRVQRPERAHRRTQLVVWLGYGVGDGLRKLGDAGQRELERRALREERTQLFQVVLGNDAGRQPWVKERDRERDVLRDPLRVELAMRARELRAYVLERESDRRLKRPRRDCSKLASRSMGA